MGADEDHLGGTDGEGSVFLFGAPPADGVGRPAQADVVLRGVHPEDAVGRTAIVGDFDGDGNTDAAVTASTARGAVFVWFAP